jgi:glycosyltransferase involved in cell wall biosynthesis
MRISIVGPNSQIPPVGWGAVESLIWDMRNTLTKMGHEVQIVNVGDPLQIISLINNFSPDFVHINYDDWIPIYPYIQYPCAITTHFAYINRPELMGGYKQRVFDFFTNIKPNVFGLSKSINQVYNTLCGIPEEKLYLNPNGVDFEIFEKSNYPAFPDSSIYLAKIDHRKRQHLFQDIDSLFYAGNISDNRFNKDKNYLGEWSKNHLYENLTHYGNLVLLSDGEAHPLVCLEAFSAGLGVVISEWASANLDLSKDFITIIPEDKISNITYVEQKIIENRKYSVQNRKEIFDYAKTFDWKVILESYYIPNILKVINGKK